MVPVDDHFYQLFFRGLVASTCANGDLRTLPCQWPHADPRLAGLDGFYAARLKRL